ncbi:hypothetical protein BHE74_00006516 [Ensete ventricosum]|nr:hypothetical protein GW17_00023726 [Ensete ventricosum]RWW84854.1 hypothetical protein BHE74_00006516 [Ensete ventricosum]RZR86265.1 hypothetical protein BHM03_00013435 [Ensete ventricosum]
MSKAAPAFSAAFSFPLSYAGAALLFKDDGPKGSAVLHHPPHHGSIERNGRIIRETTIRHLSTILIGSMPFSSANCDRLLPLPSAHCRPAVRCVCNTGSHTAIFPAAAPLVFTSNAPPSSSPTAIA